VRILTLANTPLDESQGSGYVISHFARGLAQRGHHVDLVGAPQTEWPAGFHRAIRYRQMLGIARIAARSWNQGYDIMEFYGGEAWLAISQLRRRARRKTLLVAHSNGLETHASELLARAAASSGRDSRRWYQADLSFLHERAFRRADGIVTVSHFDREYALRRGYQPDTRVLAIENSLPDELLRLKPGGERLHRVVYCGSWIDTKGIDLLCRDVGRFLIEHPDWRLLLVGVGSAEPRDQFPTAARDRIDVIARADRLSELTAIYAASAIAVQASYYESFGLATAEAMACGCAIVATRVGFAASLRDGHEAALLPEAASPHLYVALNALADDAEHRRTIAAAGHQRVQRLRWEPAIEQLESTYHDWLAALHQGVSA
jgi:glycosyltransferase involved in cell wall biosynthesis